MFSLTNVIVMAAGIACAASGNIAYIFMERRLIQDGHHPKMLKSVQEIWRVSVSYRELKRVGQASAVPLVIFQISVGGLITCLIYLLVTAAVYTHS